MTPCVLRGLAFALIAAVTLAACEPRGPVDESIAGLQAEALDSELAWTLIESLATEVGPRKAGMPGDALAVTWAQAQFQALGFDRVRLEQVTFPYWHRGFERARMVVPREQELAVTALGGSPGTNGGLAADVVHFPSLAALEAADPGSLEGRIAFISQRMERTRSGAGYNEAVIGRNQGPFVAAEKGAVALVIRSIGTSDNALAHTGSISTDREGPLVPAAAISNPDADLLVALLERGERVRLELRLDVGLDGRRSSFNVIGEFDGRENNGEYVLVGGHLDSWDIGPGVQAGASGVAVALAAAKLVADRPERPRRGIRVVLFASGEQGIHGARAYARDHVQDLASHVVGAEANFGGGRIYQFRSRVRPDAEAAMDELARQLRPLGIPRQLDRPALGGADIGQLRRVGLPVVDLNHDASLLFDVLHTANDTLAMVDPEAIAHNVAAYATFIYFAAETDTVFGPVAPSE